MTTHDPLVIGGLTKEEIRIFYVNEDVIRAVEPEFDPKGLGVDGILTSEFFNLPSSLDFETEQDVIRQYELQAKKNHDGLNEIEEKELFDLNNYLETVGLNQKSIDPLYDRFLDAIVKKEGFIYKPKTIEEQKVQDDLVKQVLKELETKK